VRIDVTFAAIAMPAFTAQPGPADGDAAACLTIRNLTGSPDELVSASSPAAARLSGSS